MRVMMLMIQSPDAETNPKPPSPEALRAMHEFNEELTRAGVLVNLGGLKPSSAGVRIQWKGGKRAVTDGPFTEAKELVAGFSLLEVKSMAEAVEWAMRAPVMADGTVEIRPLFDAADFDPPAD